MSAADSADQLPVIHDGIIDPPHDVPVLSADEFKLAFRNHPAGCADSAPGRQRGQTALG